ncbi:MAG: hypothetical protein WA704_16945, partial [Pseudolabrys sp.]
MAGPDPALQHERAQHVKDAVRSGSGAARCPVAQPFREVHQADRSSAYLPAKTAMPQADETGPDRACLLLPMAVGTCLWS